jgi:N-terminal domain on NACHT_NTPase and P-loop NTPases
MSGVEVISLVSAIISLLNTTLQIYNVAKDGSGLPASFRDVASRLPLVQDTLNSTLQSFEEDTPSPESQKAIKVVLEACEDKAAALEKIFRAVIPPAGSSRVERYRKALLTIPKADKVETLMSGILADLQVLTGNHAIKTATRVQIQKLIDVAQRDRFVETPSGQFNNMGSGSQIVHSGDGNQNINFGTGPQINGEVSGQFYFNTL